MKSLKRTGYKTLYIRLIWQFLSFVVVLNVFAFTYQAIERYSGEEVNHRKLAVTQREVLGNFSGDHNISLQQVSEFVRGYDAILLPPHEDDMNYLEALVLAISVFYTIGWGHVVPSTFSGQLFCMLSSCVGIPVTYMLVNSGANLVLKLLEEILTEVYSWFTPTRRSGTESDDERTHLDGIYRNDNVKNLERILARLLALCCVVILVAYLLVTAVALMVWEDIPYVDAVYYCFISLSTIGFKDFRPAALSDEANAFGFVGFLFFWALCGITLVVANLKVLVQVDVFGSFYQRCRCKRIRRRGSIHLSR